MCSLLEFRSVFSSFFLFVGPLFITIVPCTAERGPFLFYSLLLFFSFVLLCFFSLVFRSSFFFFFFLTHPAPPATSSTTKSNQTKMFRLSSVTPAHSADIKSLAAGPAGTIITGSRDGQAKVFQPPSPTPLRLLRNTKFINAVAFVPGNPGYPEGPDPSSSLPGFP